MEYARQPHQIRIMITDSNSRVRDLLKRELEHEGYEVFSTKNGQDILDRISSPGSIDLIILDPQLFCPYRLNLLGNLCSSAQNVPIIIHGFHDQRVYTESLQHVRFVDKDANSIKELKEAVRSCMSSKTGGIA
ncbi:MAG: response regulator [Desulfofustis sp.]|jgi:DNA-binding NtrC family response regulator|nr:response regulator [Desulfofustis sp.]